MGRLSTMEVWAQAHIDHNHNEADLQDARERYLSTPEARLASEHVIETLTGTGTPFHRIVETRNPMFGKTVDVISSNAQGFAENYLASMWLLTGENWGNTEEPGEFTPAQAQVIMTLAMEHREKAEELAAKQARFNDIEGVEFDDYLNSAQSRYANILAAQIGMVRRGAIWNMEEFEAADTKKTRDAFLRAPSLDDREQAMALISSSEYYAKIDVPGVNYSITADTSKPVVASSTERADEQATQTIHFAEVTDVESVEDEGESGFDKTDEVDASRAVSGVAEEGVAPSAESLEVDAPRREEAGAPTADEAAADESEEEQKGVMAWFKARWNNLRTKKESRRRLYVGLGVAALFGGLIYAGIASSNNEQEPSQKPAATSEATASPTATAEATPEETPEATEESEPTVELSEEEQRANEEAAEGLFGGGSEDGFDELVGELFPEE